MPLAAQIPLTRPAGTAGRPLPPGEMRFASFESIACIYRAPLPQSVVFEMIPSSYNS